MAIKLKLTSMLMNAMPAKSSVIDSIPILIIKLNVDIFAKLTTRLATLLLGEASFPAQFKIAFAILILEKKGLDLDNSAN